MINVEIPVQKIYLIYDDEEKTKRTLRKVYKIRETEKTILFFINSAYLKKQIIITMLKKEIYKIKYKLDEKKVDFKVKKI